MRQRRPGRRVMGMMSSMEASKIHLSPSKLQGVGGRKANSLCNIIESDTGSSSDPKFLGLDERL